MRGICECMIEQKAVDGKFQSFEKVFSILLENRIIYFVIKNAPLNKKPKLV